MSPRASSWWFQGSRRWLQRNKVLRSLGCYWSARKPKVDEIWWGESSSKFTKFYTCLHFSYFFRWKVYRKNSPWDLLWTISRSIQRAEVWTVSPMAVVVTRLRLLRSCVDVIAGASIIAVIHKVCFRRFNMISYYDWIYDLTFDFRQDMYSWALPVGICLSLHALLGLAACMRSEKRLLQYVTWKHKDLHPIRRKLSVLDTEVFLCRSWIGRKKKRE